MIACARTYIRKFALINFYAKVMKIRHLLFTIASSAIALCTFSSCNPTKKLKEGELLLDKNVVIDKNNVVDKNEIASYIKQKPNRKVLIWRMYLHIYNSINEDKLERQQQKCDAKVERKLTRKTEKINHKNEKRAQKNKPAKKIPAKENISTLCKLRTGFKQWCLGIGEPPVIYDSSLSAKSAKQIKLFLNNKGYFNSSVKDSVSENYLLTKIENNAIKTKNKKVKSFYIVKEGKPYTIRNVSYEIKDGQLNYFVLANASGSLLTRGENYDVDVLQK